MLSAKREQVAFKIAVEEADDPELKQVMLDSLNYVNSLVRDRQAKMRDFIRQTSQNYPKENSRNSLTSSENSGNIVVASNAHPRNIENVVNRNPTGFRRWVKVDKLCKK